MIIIDFEELRSGREQTFEFPGMVATVQLTDIGRSAARDSGAWTGVATMIESDLFEEVTHIVHRTARKAERLPPFALDCRALPPILDDMVAIVRIQAGTGGPELVATS
ncbi:MAG TPA: hypothetical protein VK903_15725 [Propionicimonas sp.]|nr:hypothetical protein [Propionicimonas sp.]